VILFSKDSQKFSNINKVVQYVKGLDEDVKYNTQSAILNKLLEIGAKVRGMIETFFEYTKESKAYLARQITTGSSKIHGALLKKSSEPISFAGIEPWKHRIGSDLSGRHEEELLG
jgi:hypothetical protein